MTDKHIKNRSGGTRWKPGQSGNLKGRPKKDVSLTSLVKMYLEEIPELMVGSQLNTLTWRQLIAKTWIVGAYKGNSVLFKELLERIEGKIALPITGGEGEPLIPPVVEFHFADGAILKPQRNGHKEIAEVATGGNGHKTDL